MSALLKRLKESGLPFRYSNKNGAESYEFLRDVPTCGARCKSTGKPCRLAVDEAGARCRFHGGLSTGPKTDAGRARIANANRRRKGTRYRVRMPEREIETGADLMALTPAQRRQWAEVESDRRAAATATAAPKPKPATPKAAAPDPNAALIALIESLTPEQRAELSAGVTPDAAGRELERRAQLAKDANA